MGVDLLFTEVGVEGRYFRECTLHTPEKIT